MSQGQSLVAQWNEHVLESIRAGSAKPTATIDQLFMTHTAIYDAWAAYEPDAEGLYSKEDRPLEEHSLANKSEAISYAAFTALVALFPDREAIFAEAMQSFGYTPYPETPSTAATVGINAAQTLFAARADDGSNRENDYATPDDYVYAPVNASDPDATNGINGPDFDPNRWEPLRIPTGTEVDENGIPTVTDDPASYVDQVVLTPHWGGVTAFALQENDAARPPAPPQLGDFSEYIDANGKVTTNDAAYREQVAEVLEASKNLTTEQKVIAELWADGPRTESPPGHWNQIAQDIALRDGHGIDDDAKLFFALNAAVFDAGVATWEAKNTYDYIRPQSAIRYLYDGEMVEAWAGPNQGMQEIPGEEWRPYQNTTFVTPPFQEFTSGHSAFSTAAAQTIAAYVGSDVYYDGVSVGNYDLDDVEGKELLGEFVSTSLAFEDFQPGEEAVVLRWATLTDAANEAGVSRIFGGIHIQDGNLRGREIGDYVASGAETYWTALFTRGGDDVITTSEQGGITYAGTGNDIVTGLDGDDIIKPGLGMDTVTTGGGEDKVSGTVQELDMLTITDLSLEDMLVVEGATLAPDGLTWLGESGILGLDTDGDGDFDATVTLQGDLSRAVFEVVQNGANSELSYTLAPIVIEGTSSNNRLRGTDADEVLISGGGRVDYMMGGAGRDIFVFTDLDGRSDSLRIADFNTDEDMLDLNGAQIEGVRQLGSTLRLTLSEDRDTIILRGVSDLGEVVFVEDQMAF